MKGIKGIIYSVRRAKKAKVIEPYLFHYGRVEFIEKFASLHDLLKSAVRKTYGKDFWVTDFSNKEVIYYKDSGDREVDAEGETIYYKMSYKVVKGEAIFTGSATQVTRATTYEEAAYTLRDFVELCIYEAQIDRLKE